MIQKAGVRLGEVDVSDGVLVILDPGLARFWRHDAEPVSPRKSDARSFDLVIQGDDATAAGRAYDREFEPLHLYDRTDPEADAKHFDEFARQRGLRAKASVLVQRVAHTDRARLALEAGDGLGVVKYNGLWAVVVRVPAAVTGAPVVGVPFTEGEFEGRWQHIDVVFDEAAEAAREVEVQGVMVDHGQLLFSGLEPLGQFRMWESLDGLADYVFWGSDAKQLSQAVGAISTGEGQFGWRDVAIEQIGVRANEVQRRIQAEKLRVAVDYRPHCNLERLNAALRQSSEDAAAIRIGDSRVVGCNNRWGDGIFGVTRTTSVTGDTLRVRVNLGTASRQKSMQQLRMRALGAIVTRAVLDDGEPIRFAERMKPSRPADSGWFFCAGVEDDAYMDAAENFRVVRLHTLIDEHPALADVLDAPEGTKLRYDGQRFVLDDA